VNGRGLACAAAAAAAARASYAVLGSRPPGGARAWTRTNHRGEAVTLLEGPAVAAGGVTGALLASGNSRQKVAMALAGTGAAAFGVYDDLAGDGSSRGFRGHLGELRHGKLTTGAVKIAGIGATGLAAALIAGRPDEHAGPARAAAADAVINAGLIAGMANLINLFDLRPGRAAKAAIAVSGLLAALPGSGGQASAAPVAAAAALLPEDLGERAMLGDAGANALGAMLGVAATGLPRAARVALLTGVAGLTAASEVVSFSRVIERTAVLRRLDMLGRRPAPPPTPAAPVPPRSPGTAREPGQPVLAQGVTPRPPAGTGRAAGTG
jgi:hypothetical protein